MKSSIQTARTQNANQVDRWIPIIIRWIHSADRSFYGMQLKFEEILWLDTEQVLDYV